MTPTKPGTVGALRGAFYAVAGAIVAIIVLITPADAEALGWWGPPLLMFARYAEARVLDRKQPLQRGPLGGTGPA